MPAGQRIPSQLVNQHCTTSLLEVGEIEVVGRLREASNQTFAVRVTHDGEESAAVYKPISGEAPLWDFPDGTLAFRERAAYLVSEALGWSVVPPTILREGPWGMGMLQRWIETGDHEPVRVVKRGDEGEFLHVLDAEDQWGRPVSLVHENTTALRRIAIFDLVVNNTDRKGSHVLASGQDRYGIDHGVCFHQDDKVRTVLWGWAGSELTTDELSSVRTLIEDDTLAAALSELLASQEVAAFKRRGTRLVRAGRMPAPRGDWPPIPWPPL